MDRRSFVSDLPEQRRRSCQLLAHSSAHPAAHVNINNIFCVITPQTEMHLLGMQTNCINVTINVTSCGNVRMTASGLTCHMTDLGRAAEAIHHIA